ncbi:MAG: hypothetical protein ABI823_21400, partial [Bryobacteraceae bacterium]
RLGAGGKADVFYDPKAKYIWALTVSRAGDLFVATGDDGEIHRVTRDGRGSVFFKSEETHVRSMAMDVNDNIIAGTDPSGLILRVTSAGQGFVLYQAPKREITAVAVAADGSIYASGTGAKSEGALALPATPPATPAPKPQSGAITIQTGTAGHAPAPPSLAAAAPSVTGGSEVYRIQPDGYPKKVWSHPQDIAYAIAVDESNTPLIATGNKGNIYRLDREGLYTMLVHVPPTQVTSLLATPAGVFAATGNIGKVYQIGPAMETSGTFESELLDAGGFTYWGRMRYQGKANESQVKLETRSGNLGRAQNNWSPWSAVPLTNMTGRIAAPAARFLQYRATLSGTAEVGLFEIAYQGKNVAPTVEIVEVTPANYKFPTPSGIVLTNQSLTLSPLGKRSAASASAVSVDTGLSPSMTYAKGQVGVRWLSNDENGDTLQFRVEIRGAKESQWKPLKDKIRERYYSWDSTAYPDGEYYVRVSASDEPSNPPDQALSGQMESDRFLIDNTPPEISELRATPQGNRLEIRWKAKDALSIIGKAEYSINGGEWRVADPTTKLTDSLQHDYTLTIERPAGEVTVAVRVSDEIDNQAASKIVVK